MSAPMESMEESENCCEIEATVVTGFEQLAKEEVLEKLDVTASTERGKINFEIPITKTKKVLELSSIDNAYVVIKRYGDFVFADDVATVLQQFRDIVPEIPWQHGLRVWREVFSFDHPISHLPCSSYKNPSVDDTEQADSADAAPEATAVPPGDQEGEEPVAKRVRKTAWHADMPAFRATCYRTGKHLFQSPQAAAEFGGEIHNYFGWNVDMKKFNIEVVLTVENQHVYVCLGLTKESLHRRHITQFGPTTLRPTIAYNILRFCRIKDYDVVCDPMCGGGSIPLEAALNWPNAVHICGDIFDKAPPRARENIDTVNELRKADGKKAVAATVFRWDASRLPLKDESVDVFVTDMPFGKRSGSKLSNWHLYPRVLRDMARVSKTGSGKACLLTQDRKCLNKTLMSLEGLWRRGPIIGINIGGLAAGVFLLFRTAKKFTSDHQQVEPQKSHRPPESASSALTQSVPKQTQPEEPQTQEMT